MEDKIVHVPETRCLQCGQMHYPWKSCPIERIQPSPAVGASLPAQEEVDERVADIVREHGRCIESWGRAEATRLLAVALDRQERMVDERDAKLAAQQAALLVLHTEMEQRTVKNKLANFFLRPFITQLHRLLSTTEG